MKSAHPDRERVIDGIWRRLSPQERTAWRGGMNSDVRSRLCAFLINLFPDATLEERKFLFVQARYGQAVAERLRSWLNRPQNGRALQRWQQHDSGFAKATIEVEASRRADDRRGEGLPATG